MQSLPLFLKQLFLYTMLQTAALALSPLNWPTLHRISHCVHLGSLGRSRTFIFAQQGTSTAAPARTGVGVGTFDHGPSSPAPEGGRRDLCFPRDASQCCKALQGTVINKIFPETEQPLCRAHPATQPFSSSPLQAKS